MLELNFKKLKPLLFGLAVVVGLLIFYVAVIGQANTPLWDSKYEMTRCPDWKFHQCYANSLDLSQCTIQIFCGTILEACESTLRVYHTYPALIHNFAHYAGVIVMPPAFWLAIILTACWALLGFLAFKYGGKSFGKVLAPAIFFLGIPFLLAVSFGQAPYTWVDLTECGLVPFVFVFALFLFGLYEAKNLGNVKLALLFVAMALGHNYGIVLGFALLACLIASWLVTRDYSLAKYFALTGVFIWIQISVYLPSIGQSFGGSERMICLLFFIMAVEAARLTEKIID